MCWRGVAKVALRRHTRLLAAAGFVHELECPETAELLLRFVWDLGAATYRRVAAGGGADSRTATCIVQELERRRRAWDGAVRDAAASS